MTMYILRAKSCQAEGGGRLGGLPARTGLFLSLSSGHACCVWLCVPQEDSKLGGLVHAKYPSIWDIEVGVSGVQGQP